MKKLRLLVTKYCPKNCIGCCNKDWNLDSLPTAEHYDYDEILITGGEPLSNINKYKTKALLDYLSVIDTREGRKIYVYTANSIGLEYIINECVFDGAVLTLHSNEDVEDFLAVNKGLLYDFYDEDNNHKIKNKSLRLNIFKGVELPDNVNLSLWKVKKDIVWIENCPLPEGEVFMKLKNIH